MKGRRNDGIFSWRESEAITYFTGVDEVAAHGYRILAQQYVWAKVNIMAAFVLEIERSTKTGILRDPIAGLLETQMKERFEKFELIQT